MTRPATDQMDLGRFEEPAILILTSLLQGPRWGYAIVKDVETVSGVHLGPGTLYATLARLEARGLIQGLPSEDRRRPYRITGTGRAQAWGAATPTGSTTLPSARRSRS